MSRPRSNRWAGPGVRRAHDLLETTLPRPCGKCGVSINPGEEFNTGHVVARWEDPTLTWVPSNWVPEHKGCSDRSGQGEALRKARHEGAMAERERLGLPCNVSPMKTEGDGQSESFGRSQRVFPRSEHAEESPLR